MKNRDLAIMSIIGFIVLLLVTAVYVGTAGNLREDLADRSIGINHEDILKYHIVMIVESTDEPFWQSVRRGAEEAARDLKVAIECNGPRKYDSEEEIKYFDIAIASRVDGIITHVTDPERITPYIDKAVDMGIPVIALNDDAQFSKRQSFVGVNNYNLGVEWGRLIVDASGGEGVVAMISPDNKGDESTYQDMILSGLKESIKNYPDIQLRRIVVKDSEIFSAEEAIRQLIINENEVTMLLCMNATDTIRAANAVVDLNKVSKVNIVGYHDNSEILNYVKTGVIFGTIAGDAHGMGYKSVEAIVELKESNRVSEYITSKLNVITHGNVERYIRDKEEKERLYE